VKTQCHSQCQAQRLVRSSHNLSIYEFWVTFDLLCFSISFVFLNAHCICLQNKHPRSIKESSGRTSQSLQSTYQRWAETSLIGDIGRERVKHIFKNLSIGHGMHIIFLSLSLSLSLSVSLSVSLWLWLVLPGQHISLKNGNIATLPLGVLEVNSWSK
jgi:hypothetical protein